MHTGVEAIYKGGIHAIFSLHGKPLQVCRNFSQKLIFFQFIVKIDGFPVTRNESWLNVCEIVVLMVPERECGTTRNSCYFGMFFRQGQFAAKYFSSELGTPYSKCIFQNPFEYVNWIILCLIPGKLENSGYILLKLFKLPQLSPIFSKSWGWVCGCRTHANIKYRN